MDLISPNFKDLLRPNIEIKKFPDGDSYVRIPQLKQCEGKEITLYHRLWPKQDRSLMQVLLILETLKQVGASVTIIAPYLPYARQDKVVLDGEIKSSEIICKLLASAGCKKIITFDCHFLKKEGEFNYAGLAIKNISMNNALITHAKKLFGEEQFETISPDEGARYMVAAQGGKSMKKRRGGYEQGELAYRGIEKMEGKFDFHGKNVLIIDDMVATGSTMIKAVENVKANGAKRIACAATHGFFLRDSLAKLRTQCEFVFVSNSIISPVSEVNIMEKLKMNSY